VAQVTLCKNKEALAVEEEPVRGAPRHPQRGVRQLLQEATALRSTEVAARMSSRRPNEGLDRACIVVALSSRQERASAAEFKCPGRYSMTKSNPNSLLIH
jgi:hypothetical protein